MLVGVQCYKKKQQKKNKRKRIDHILVVSIVYIKTKYNTFKFVKHYLNHRDDEVNWEASPLYAPKLTNQPPTYIFAAELDPLIDEGVAYKNRLENNKNLVSYKLYKGQIHGFVTNSKHFPKGLDCLKEIGNAIKKLIRT